MKSIKQEILLEKARNICKICEFFHENELFFSLKHNLEAAAEFCESADTRKPLIITLVGGTGVGKSFIFSVLCGYDGASPSSSSVRGFTQKPYIAASEEDRPFLPFSSTEAVFLPGLMPGMVLIDTPDLDTINDNNVRLARETISASDIVVCVTTPDKRSDFAINSRVIEWSSRKRWFFVINKLDTVPEVTEESLRADLVRRLQTLGFATEPTAEFIFSARQPDSSEFKRFKDTIISSRSISHNAMLRREASIRHFLHAIDDNKCCSGILKLLHELKSAREILSEKVRQSQEEIASSASVVNLTSNLLTTNLYHELAANCSLFLFPYFYVLSWLSGNPGHEKLKTGLSMAINGSFVIKECYADERRCLEDKALPYDCSEAISLPKVPTLAEQMHFQIARHAQATADSALFRFYVFTGNLVPFIILFQALYRAVANWLTGTWLPSDFFIHAIFLVAAATLPGYLLIAKAVNRTTAAFKIAAPLNEPQLINLDTNIEKIEDLLQEASIMTTGANAYLAELKTELPCKSFGIHS
ncbi:MAG: 50S ribosome-binding GTPase [Candidatus Riflebacteria bacterium]|nr:50S ribosome-binding GTPase [Candidatus Riflebacteria bacterium]